MSVTIQFIQTTDKKIELNKSYTIALQWKLTGLLRVPTDMINPVVEIEETADVSPLKFSYCKINEFDRFYFIENAVCIRNNRWALYLHEDVLMSHQTYILAQNAFVLRWSASTDKTIRDNECNFEYKKEIIEANITNTAGASNITTLTVSPDPMTGYNTVIAYMTDYTNIQDMSSSGANAFESASTPSSYTVGGNVSCIYYVGTGAIAHDIARAIYKNSSLKSYVKHITMYPFNITSTAKNDILSIEIGNTTINLNTVPFRYANYVIERIKIADFKISSTENSTLYNDDFTAAEPYSTYEIYIPYVGWVNLPSEYAIDKRIRVWYAVNYEEGTATAYISSGSSIYNIIYSSPCVMGTKIGLSYDNTLELETARNALYLNTATSLGSTALAAAGGGDNAGLNAASGLLKTGAAFVNGWNSLIPRGNTAINSSTSGLNLYQKVSVRVTRTKKKNYDSDFAVTYGLPYNKYDSLTSLSGFVKVGDIQFTESNIVLDNEKKEIESILKSGYIYTLPTP